MSNSGREVASKFLEQKSAVGTVELQGNESPRNARPPAVCETVPHKNCPMQNDRGTPDEKQCQRALIGRRWCGVRLGKRGEHT